MVTAPGLIVALLSPLAGFVTDRAGRRIPLLIATFFYGVFGIAPFFLDSLPVIFSMRFGVGLCEAVVLTVANTLITDYFPPDRRRHWLTVQNVAGPIFATAVIVGSSILTGFRWNGGFLIYGIAFLIFAALCVGIFEPDVTNERSSSVTPTGPDHLPWTTVLQFGGVTLFSSMLYYVFIVQGGLAFTAIGVTSPERLGILISVASVGVPIGAGLFGWLGKRWPINWLITGYLTCLGVGMLAISGAKTPAVMAGVAIIQQVGAGMAIPALVFWVSQVMPTQYRGRGMGFWACSFFLGQFLSPALVGVIRALTGGGILAVFSTMGVVALVGAAISASLTRRFFRMPASSDRAPKE
jgi:MFS family permease